MFTDQTSCAAPRMLATASIAVSIEWSWLLYLCIPLRPTGHTFDAFVINQRRMISTLFLYSWSYTG